MEEKDKPEYGSRFAKLGGIAVVGEKGKEVILQREVDNKFKWSIVPKGEPVLGPSPIQDLLKEMKALRDYRDMVEVSYKPKGYIGDNKYSPVTFEQSHDAKVNLMEELNAQLAERYHQALYGQSFRRGNEVINPSNVGMDLGSYNHAVDAMRYSIGGGAIRAGKTAGIAEYMNIEEDMVARHKGILEAFDLRPNFIREAYGLNLGWKNHGGNFNIIVRKQTWDEEYMDVVGSAW